ncbi:MAG: hypothetical protein JOZ18_17590, partial [Chloroflexi bacterium]|nr:hypothetical protein [Chloroflexota bacterium]
MSSHSLKKTPQASSAHTEHEQRYKPASSALTWWAAASFAAIVGFSRISYGLLLSSIRADLRGAYSLYGLVNTANFVGYLLGTLALPLL